MPVYFEKINCVKELTRAIVRHKPITLLLPDSEVHGEFTPAMIRDIVTEIISIKNVAMSIAEQEQLLQDICNDVVGYGPLEPLLARDDISDIMVNGADSVFIEVNGKVVNIPSAQLKAGDAVTIREKAKKQLDEAQTTLAEKSDEIQQLKAIILKQTKQLEDNSKPKAVKDADTDLAIIKAVDEANEWKAKFLSMEASHAVVLQEKSDLQVACRTAEASRWCCRPRSRGADGLQAGVAMQQQQPAIEYTDEVCPSRVCSHARPSPVLQHLIVLSELQLNSLPSRTSS